MHRSGTSALTRVLSFMGAGLPVSAMGAGEGNEAGHWESERLAQCHDALFSDAASAWHDWRPLDLTRLSPSRLERLEADFRSIIDADFAGEALFVLKDPRICRAPGLTLSAVEGLGMATAPILAFRNPLEVIGSLMARKAYWPSDLSRADAALLWLSHNLEAERATRNAPRVVLDAGDLAATWPNAVARVIEQLGVAFPNTVDAARPLIEGYLDTSRRRQTADAAAVGVDPDTRGWVSDVYDALRLLEAEPGSTHALRLLDRTAAAFDASWRTLDRVKAAAEERVRTVSARAEAADAADQARIAAADEAASLAAAVTEADRKAQKLESDLAWAQDELNRLRAVEIALGEEAARHRADADRKLADVAALVRRERAAAAAARDEAAREKARAAGAVARQHLATGEARELTRLLGLEKSAVAYLGRALEGEQSTSRALADAANGARAHVAHLELRYEETRGHIAWLERELHETRVALDAAWRHVDAIQRDYRASTSWRVTAPLRAAIRGPGMVLRLAAATPRAIAMGGGLVPTIAKALTVLSREGIGGLRQRYSAVRAAIASGGPTPAAPQIIDVTDEPQALPAPAAPSFPAPPAHASSPEPAGAFRGLYESALHVALGDRSVHYAPRRQVPPRKDGSDVKVVAFYLPQFHLFPENEAWWGAGFNEWTNVTKAQPVFVGHEQPKLPADLGFYDLTAPGVMGRQADLAKAYGVDGFCFHFYWFGGKRLMEQPLLNWLGDASIDLPFMLCWANENWTRRWDGAEHDLLIGQQHSPEDDEAFLRHVAQYMRDPRYIRIDGKPALVVYRPSLLPDPAATLQRWRRLAEGELGLGGLHLIATNSFGFGDYGTLGFDALVEFPPHGVVTGRMNDTKALLTDRYSGIIYSYPDVVARAQVAPDTPGRIYPAAFPAWDNTARRPVGGNIFADATPALFRDWLETCFARARRTLPQDGRVVFVNAWNEWAEGAYLEPDRRHGHANLWAVADVIEQHAARDPDLGRIAAEANARARPRDRSVAVVHAYYPEVARELAADLAAAGVRDVILTVPDTLDGAVLADLISAYDAPHVVIAPNRGRDVAPFLAALDLIVSRHPGRWDWVLKLHTKRSPHERDGAAWRRKLVSALASAKAGGPIAAALKDPKAGLVCGASALMATAGDAMARNRAHCDALMSRMGHAPLKEQDQFVAGTMFWARLDALAPLAGLRLTPEAFEPELGQIDGTLAHAVERVIAALATRQGYTIVGVPD